MNPSFAASLVDGSPVTGRTPPKRPQKKPTAVDSKPVEIEIDSSDPVQGKEDAKVTVAIFSDFECPFCSKLVPTMERIREEYGEDVRFVFKQHPLSFHKNARLAAKASLAANQQGKFWEYHDVLFANQRALKRDQLIGYADQLGLDREKFIAHMDSPEAEAAVKEDMLAAQKIGVRGTPHSFINGVRLKGAKPYAAFEAEIAKVLGKKKGLNDAAAPTTGKVGLGEARGRSTYGSIGPRTRYRSCRGDPLSGPAGPLQRACFQKCVGWGQESGVER